MSYEEQRAAYGLQVQAERNRQQQKSFEKSMAKKSRQDAERKRIRDERIAAGATPEAQEETASSTPLILFVIGFFVQPIWAVNWYIYRYSINEVSRKFARYSKIAFWVGVIIDTALLITLIVLGTKR